MSGTAREYASYDDEGDDRPELSREEFAALDLRMRQQDALAARRARRNQLLLKSSPRLWPAPGVAGAWLDPKLRKKPTCEYHALALDGLATVVSTLRDRWWGKDSMSLSTLAGKAGASPSAVEAAFAGRNWPSLRTLGGLAAVFDYRLLFVEVAGKRPQRLPAGRPGRPPNREALEQAAGDDPVALAAAWHNAALAELWWRLRAADFPASRAAAATGLRPMTVRESRPDLAPHPCGAGCALARAHAPHRWVSTQVMLGLASLLPMRLAVVPRNRAWPLAPWQERSSLMS